MLAFALLALLAPSPAPPADVVATVDGVPITAHDLEEAGGPRLFAARSQFYSAQRQALDEAIARLLVDKEAKARGTTAEALLREEIDQKVAPVTEAEKKAFFEQNRARVPPDMAEEEAMRQIENHLRQQRVGARRNEFLEALRARAAVKVNLDPPRIAVATDDDPAKGPAAAPVTIVEFSDFQCPFCARVVPTLKQLDERYGDKVRLVFRDLPLPNHADAPRAAEAASCAHEQGKFWPMHDVLFANQQKLSAADMPAHAQAAGLEAAAFAACLESGRHAAEWKKDAADAERYGVQSTPAFFINGRMLVGAVPLENFTRLIDEELERAGVPVPAPKPVQPDAPDR